MNISEGVNRSKVHFYNSFVLLSGCLSQAAPGWGKSTVHGTGCVSLPFSDKKWPCKPFVWSGASVTTIKLVFQLHNLWGSASAGYLCYYLSPLVTTSVLIYHQACTSRSSTANAVIKQIHPLLQFCTSVTKIFRKKEIP